MAAEPQTKRAVAFFDGQNLYHSAKAAFGYTFPNYDPVALANLACAKMGWNCEGVYFYTGIPDAADNAFWNHFWVAKGAQMGRMGVKVYTRSLRYRNKTVKLPDGTSFSFLDGDEKGIDVRPRRDPDGSGAHLRRSASVLPRPRPVGGGGRAPADLRPAKAVDQNCVGLSLQPSGQGRRRHPAHRLGEDRSGRI
ncbi:MAG TPA: hypothetical protein VMU93_13720 [Caulobacteraceae bacterium]|nr:hypothetical protein [Caulobacteraceae bacterium]